MQRTLPAAPHKPKHIFRRPDSARNGQIGYNPPFFFKSSVSRNIAHKLRKSG